MAYPEIEDHGIIGNLRTVALVAKDGCIDCMCYPDFDSPTVFASLLDEDAGGRFDVRASGRGHQHQQLYIPDTNVLLTRTLTEKGTLEVTHFMPVDGPLAGFLMRRVEVTRGAVGVDVTCSPRFDYARREPHVDTGDRAARFSSGANALRLTATGPLAAREAAAEARVELRAGECAAFALGPADAESALVQDAVDAAYLNDRYGTPAVHHIWTELSGLTDQAATRWREADHGLWELPGRPREYLSSKLLCWVALDRAVALATHRSLPAPIDRWRETRDTIYCDIFERFWDDDKQAFVQAADHRAMDASVLLMPLLRFISHTDPRWLSTLRAVERELVEDGLVYRYRQGNGSLDPLPGREAPFTICTFWYVECLSRAGRLDEASLAFEKTVARGNHLGHFAEQIMPGGHALGNFPQAYSHLALISAAFDIDKRSQ